MSEHHSEDAGTGHEVATVPACSPELLKTLFLFEKLSDDQLTWLCERGRVEQFDVGPVFTEGEASTCFFVLVDGEVALSRRVQGDDVEVNRTDYRGSYGGATAAYLGDRAEPTYGTSMRALRPSTFFVLPGTDLSTAMNDWFPMAVHMLDGLRVGMTASNQATNERERLLALGSLSAGLTHELNNPAAAAVRAVASLRDRVSGMRHKLKAIAAGKFDPETIVALVQAQEEAADRVAKAPVLGPVEAGDREDTLADWLDDHGVTNSWNIAPTFVAGGIDIDWLEHLSDNAGASLPAAVGWLNYTVETELLMNEIGDSAERISSLVGAAKQYSQLDRAPFREVDVHELLDSTVTMLGRKLSDVEVVKAYDRSLPPVPAYAAELNQVWTNLIDNAVSAMDGHGTLTLRTERIDDQAVISVEDTGPGIDPDVRSRIFEPFFTTKPVGQGTGLGLDISYRIVVRKHHGDILVESQPGHTVFKVRLPLTVASPPATTDADHPGEQEA